LISRKLGIETIVAAFTDHSTVCLRLTVDVPFVRIGRGFWKKGNTLLDDSVIMEKLRDIWGQLTQQQRFFPMHRCGGTDVANRESHVF
jgi:hypothetical protein